MERKIFKHAGIGIAAVCLLMIGAVIAWEMVHSSDVPYPSVQEYAAGQWNIKGNVDAEKYTSLCEDFAIGANRDGYAVFKDPHKAFDALVVMYGKGIKRIQEEYGLSDISYTNYADYKFWGWQLNRATDEEREQAHFVVKFLDVYENSFIGK